MREVCSWRFVPSQKFHVPHLSICLRKSVWKELPLPCVPYGEDQLWADMIIKNGYEKLYVKDAVVKHSHDYNTYESFERAQTESEFFSSCFGYNYHQNIQSAYNGISSDLHDIFKQSQEIDCTSAQINSKVQVRC